MNPPIEEHFRQALGVRREMRFAVTGPDGSTVETSLSRPCAVVGRGEDAHIPLADETVSFRHAYLQAIGNRLLCIDLFGPNTVRYDDAAEHQWISACRSFQVGAYRFRLQDDGWEKADGSVRSPLDCKTRDGDSSEYGVMPDVELRLLNEGLEHIAWPINRVVTLVGRDERCRVKCVDETVSRVHCSLLLLPTGLWIVDLLGKGGTIVDGTPTAMTLLRDGSTLQVGRYRMQVRYLTPPAALPPPAIEKVEFLTRHHNIFKVSWDGDTLIVTPQGRSHEFRYQDIQVEANRVISVLRIHGFRNLLVDFSAVKLCGSVMIDSVTQFCRATQGMVALCGCSPEQYSSLQDMNLSTLWPIYSNRVDAIRAFRAASVAAAQGRGL